MVTAEVSQPLGACNEVSFPLESNEMVDIEEGRFVSILSSVAPASPEPGGC